MIKEEGSKEEDRQEVEVKQCYGSNRRFKTFYKFRTEVGWGTKYVLSESIKEKDSVQSFRASLKTHLFT